MICPRWVPVRSVPLCRDGVSRAHRSVAETTFEGSLASPPEFTVITAKYQVPGSRSPMHEVRRRGARHLDGPRQRRGAVAVDDAIAARSGRARSHRHCASARTRTSISNRRPITGGAGGSTPPASATATCATATVPPVPPCHPPCHPCHLCHRSALLLLPPPPPPPPHARMASPRMADRTPKRQRLPSRIPMPASKQTHTSTSSASGWLRKRCGLAVRP